MLSDFLKSHPATNTTLVRQLMDDHGYKLLYTPPYESWMQPIELVWARVKHNVARQAHSKRKWQETVTQTRDALSAIPADLCRKLVERTEKLMDTWLTTEAAGSLRRFGSMYALSVASPADRSRCTDLAVEETMLVGEAEVEQENEA